jgi:hypothetical protein
LAAQFHAGRNQLFLVLLVAFDDVNARFPPADLEQRVAIAFPVAALLRQVTHLRDMQAARDRMKAHRIDRALLVDEVVAAVGAQPHLHVFGWLVLVPVLLEQRIAPGFEWLPGACRREHRSVGGKAAGQEKARRQRENGCNASHARPLLAGCFPAGSSPNDK